MIWVDQEAEVDHRRGINIKANTRSADRGHCLETGAIRIEAARINTEVDPGIDIPNRRNEGMVMAAIVYLVVKIVETYMCTFLESGPTSFSSLLTVSVAAKIATTGSTHKNVRLAMPMLDHFEIIYLLQSIIHHWKGLGDLLLSDLTMKTTT